MFVYISSQSAPSPPVIESIQDGGRNETEGGRAFVRNFLCFFASNRMICNGSRRNAGLISDLKHWNLLSSRNKRTLSNKKVYGFNSDVLIAKRFWIAFCYYQTLRSKLPRKYSENTLKAVFSSPEYLSVYWNYILPWQKTAYWYKQGSSSELVKKLVCPFINPNKCVDSRALNQCIAEPLCLEFEKTEGADGSRLYQQKFPSVTTILQQTKPANEFFALRNWQKAQIVEHGEERFKEMSQTVTRRGTDFHQVIMCSEDRKMCIAV